MNIEYTKETVWTDELGTHRVQSEPKPRTLKKDLKAMKGLKKVAAYTAAVLILIVLVLIGLAIAGGIYLLLGWALGAAVAYITSGAIVLAPLQGALVLIVLSFIGSFFR